jgi:hypothetical protein
VRQSLLALLALSCLLPACGADDPVPGPKAGPGFAYPLDDTLRLHHVQVKSTHNSYHVETDGNEIDPWRYTHLPLGQQLGEQGVRHFELDVHYSAAKEAFDVYHLPVIDEQTTCRTFKDCLGALKTWSDAHPAHHAIVVQMEIKDPEPADFEAYFEALHVEIRAVWPSDRLFTPAMLKADHASLADAVRSDGWPTLGELRGKILFTLDDAGAFQRAYSHDRSHLDDRILFAHAAPEDPFAAIAVLNDPFDAAAISAATSANMLVRTRADSDSVEPMAGDTARREAALASGAHFVSTDYPVPDGVLDYSLEVPGGTPSRCNPVTAPAECTSLAIEDPAFVR